MKYHKKKLIILCEPEDIDRIAIFIGEETSGKIKANSEKITKFAKKIGNATSFDQIKNIVLNENANANSKKLDKLGNAVIDNKKRITALMLYKFIASISMLTGLALGGIVNNKWSVKLRFMSNSFSANRERIKDLPPFKDLHRWDTEGEIDYQQNLRESKQGFWRNLWDSLTP